MSGQAWRVTGNPTDEEVAAVVAALTAAASAPASAGVAPTSTVQADGWSAYWRGLRGPTQTGPSAWRASGLPLR